MRKSLCHSRDDHVLALVVLAHKFIQYYFMCVRLVVGLQNYCISHYKGMASAKRIFIAALLSSSRCRPTVEYVTV